MICDYCVSPSKNVSGRRGGTRRCVLSNGQVPTERNLCSRTLAIDALFPSILFFATAFGFRLVLGPVQVFFYVTACPRYATESDRKIDPEHTKYI